MIYAFEAVEVSLPTMPLAVRRLLDASGRKLSLDGWLSLPLDDRKLLVVLGSADVLDPTLAEPILARATPPAAPLAPVAEPPEDAPPAPLVQALGPTRPLEVARWRGLRPLDRYALVKLAAKPERLAAAYAVIVGVHLAHLGADGEARMVDVGAKAATARRAVAAARVTTTLPVLDAIAAGETAKGDVFAAARIAGIMAAKRTPELIPLCHGIALTHVEIAFTIDRDARAIDVQTTAEAVDRTGVEMEAMVAASVAALTIYDMLKSADRWMTIESVKLLGKSGGKSGDLERPR